MRRRPARAQGEVIVDLSPTPAPAYEAGDRKSGDLTATVPGAADTLPQSPWPQAPMPMPLRGYKKASPGADDTLSISQAITSAFSWRHNATRVTQAS